MRTRVVLFVAAIVTAGGCSWNPPYVSGSDLADRIRASVSGMQGDIEVHANGGWFPYADGFAEGRRVERPIRGALAITESALVFVIWDEDLHRLDAAKRIPYSEISAVELVRQRARSLMVVRLRDHNMHSFDVRDDHERVDSEEVERITRSLRSRLARKEGAA